MLRRRGIQGCRSSGRYCSESTRRRTARSIHRLLELYLVTVRAENSRPIGGERQPRLPAFKFLGAGFSSDRASPAGMSDLRPPTPPRRWPRTPAAARAQARAFRRARTTLDAPAAKSEERGPSDDAADASEAALEPKPESKPRTAPRAMTEEEKAAVAAKIRSRRRDRQGCRDRGAEGGGQDGGEDRRAAHKGQRTSPRRPRRVWPAS